MRKQTVFLQAFILPFLIGSGSGSGSTGNKEPTDLDINKAMNVVFDEAIAKTLEMGGPQAADLAPELHSTKKIACSKAENNNGFNCDIEIDSTVPLVGRSKQIVPARFVEGEAGWVAIQE